jgi:hypothetical protein
MIDESFGAAVLLKIKKCLQSFARGVLQIYPHNDRELATKSQEVR